MAAVKRKQICLFNSKTTATTWRIWLMLLILLLLSFPLFSQVKVKNFQHLTLKDGLSDTQCHQVIQDQNGFLWVSTRDGLNKYDGYDFTVYNNHSGNQNRINGNFINFFLEDAWGNLLIWYREQNLFLDVLNLDNNEVQKLEFTEEKGTGNWFIGGITDENERITSLTFDFLEEGKTYNATIYKDGTNAHWNNNPQDFELENIEVAKDAKMDVKLAPGGGFAISIIEKK